MFDGLSLGPDAQANSTFAGMRATESEGKIANGVEIVPGAFFVIDPEGELKGSFKTGGEQILSLSYRVLTPVRWFALHVAAGAFPLENSMIAGLICKSEAEQAAVTKICLRSGLDGGFRDTFFPKSLVSYAEPSVHIDLVRLDQDSNLILNAEWREIVFFFPRMDSELALSDLRFFIA